MRVAVVFDTPYDSWHYEDHARQMAKEVAAWKDEPTIEILSGLDRRRFDRRPLVDDDATRRAVNDAAERAVRADPGSDAGDH